MHYNLLDYGNTMSNCTSSNNSSTKKDHALATITAYLHPDILGVVELGNSNALAQHLLDSALNTNGTGYYLKANYTNFASSSIVNMLYFNKQKLGLLSQDVVVNSLRDINIYVLYYKAADLALTHDTAYLTAIVAHLKAGGTTADQSERAAMTSQSLEYLSVSYPPGNYIFSGDFNLTGGSTEQAYQNLLNYTNANYRFFDPASAPGNWSQNPAFSGLHTISTHASTNGCASGYGLDSRFDFIMASGSLMSGTHKITALTQTYKAVGQDALHYQLSVNGAPVNTSVPPAVLTALYDMSDHLPVIMDLKIGSGAGIATISSISRFDAIVNNPASGSLCLSLTSPEPNRLYLDLLTLPGQRCLRKDLGRIDGHMIINIPLEGLEKGLYFLKIADDAGHSLVKKVVVD
jgi:hypothetical protein